MYLTKYKPIVFLFFLFFIFSGCANYQFNRMKKFTQKKEILNMVRINDTLYVDKSEMSNIGWQEFMAWNKNIDEPLPMIHPDTAFWYRFDTCLTGLSKIYHVDPDFFYYPVVNIDQRQANLYSKWRTERVFEGFLHHFKFRKISLKKGNLYNFKMEDFYENDLVATKFPKDKLLYPHFRLPTEEEWLLIAHYADSIESKIYKHSLHESCKDYYPCFWSNIIPCENDTLKWKPTRNVNECCGPYDSKIIYNIRGNVSEWTMETNTAMGGSWKDKRHSILKYPKSKETSANSWTGFRNVMVWRKWTGSTD